MLAGLDLKEAPCGKKALDTVRPQWRVVPGDGSKQWGQRGRGYIGNGTLQFKTITLGVKISTLQIIWIFTNIDFGNCLPRHGFESHEG